MKNVETNQDNIGADSEIPKGRERSEERRLAEAPVSGQAGLSGKRGKPKATGSHHITTEELAAKYRLKTTRDECGDSIIPGKRGHLYCDDGQVCAMWENAPPMNRSKLAQLGGKLWMGDIGRNREGRRVQDVKITGVSPEKISHATRLVGAKTRRVLSEAEQKARRKGYAASPLFSVRSQGPSQPPESIPVAEVIPNCPGGSTNA
jgi:hypothetical protein